MNELLKKCALFVTENEKCANKYRLHSVSCKVQQHVMSVNEFEKFSKKIEKCWEMDD